MIIKEDNTYNEIRRKSLMQWLDEMETKEDISVRCGVKLNRDYIEYLEKEIKVLKDQMKLKDKYLNKVMEKRK